MKMSRLKKSVIMIWVFMVLLAVNVMCIHSVDAYAKVTVNAKSVKLYGLDSWAEEYIKIPSSKQISYKLVVKGAKKVTYSVLSGKSVTVSKKGVIKPNYTVWYWNGNIGSTVSTGVADEVVRKQLETGKSVVKIVADGQTFKVSVNVSDYAQVYAGDVMNKYIKANIKSSMTEYEKLDSICKFVAGFDYGADASGAVTMIVKGRGDCWASTDTIIKMCKKVGMNAWARNGNRDPGAGSGHMNAMVEADGKYYEAEAGYAEPAPRYYSIRERKSLFSYTLVADGIELYQYDGQKTNLKTLNIPKKIEGRTVVGLGEGFLWGNDYVEKVVVPSTVTYINDFAFRYCAALKSFNISANIKKIGNGVFLDCKSLKKLSCDSKNKYYSSKDGVLYNKNKTQLLYAPAIAKISIPSTVKAIADYSFYSNSNLKSVVIPSSVESIGEQAFGNCSNLAGLDIKGAKLKKIGDYAFVNCYKLKTVKVPSSLKTIGENVFIGCYNITIKCKKGSKIAAYAKKNNIKYKYY